MIDKIFGPQKPFDKFNFFLKATIGLVMLALFFGVSFLLNRMQFGTELEKASIVLGSLDAVLGNKVAAGGDVVVEPVNIPEPKIPKLIGELLPPENFTAESMIVKDHDTGAVLYKKNEYNKRSIASITKLMSALVILEKDLNWESTTTVIGEDELDTHIYAGDIYTLDELWHAALIGSSNKAILSLVNALDWPIEAFVERMNQKAVELGITTTTFIDPTGLEEGNKSTASDLAILLEEALKSEKIKEALLTFEYNLYSEQREKKHHMWNTNWLLLGWVQNNFEHILGGKTGYIGAAGYNFVIQVGDKDGRVVDVVILGTKEHEARFTEARDAAEMVLTNYQWPEKMQNAE